MTLADVQAAVGGAVVDFLWQGALIAAVAWAALRALGSEDAEARHAVALVGLAAACVTFVATAAASVVDAAEASRVAALCQTAPPAADGEPGPRGRAIVAIIWVLGAAVTTLRFAAGTVVVARLRREALPPPGDLARTFDELRHALGVRGRVGVQVSARVLSPVVVGVLQPLVLVPTSALTLLPPEQLRAVLAHELAHVRRLDPITNVLVAATQALLFFHPLVWWLARVVREERELSCDRVAVRATGDGLALAKALTQLESLRLQPSTALAAKHERGSLMLRITRILQTREARVSIGTRLCAAAAAATLALGAGVAHASISPSALLSNAASQDAREEYAALQKRLDRVVEQGWMTKDERARILGAVGQRMKASEAKRDAATTARFKDFAAQLKLAVGEGWMTAEEARRTLGAAKRRMAGELPDAGSTNHYGDKVEEYARGLSRKRADRGAKDLPETKVEPPRAAPDPEDGAAKLRREKASAADSERAELERRIRRYLAEQDAASKERRVEAEDRSAGELETLKRRLEGAVREGDLSKEEARRKLEVRRRELERRVKRSPEGADDSTEKRKPDAGDLDAAVRKIRGAVRSGDLSREEAQKKVIELRRKASARESQRDAGAQPERALRRAAEKIKSAMESGELSPDEAHRALVELKRNADL